MWSVRNLSLRSGLQMAVRRQQHPLAINTNVFIPTSLIVMQQRFMAGHSKWKTIQHKKAAVDAKRSRAFSRITQEIASAVREGGSSTTGNSRLSVALDKAKSLNMPKNNVEKAIKKGESGSGGGEEVTYEGHGPGGIAVFVRARTDNRHRTAPRIRHLFRRTGGELGANGSVSWMFSRKGVIAIPKASFSDTLLDACLENGAEDVDDSQDEEVLVICEPESLQEVQTAVTNASVEVINAGVVMHPNDTASVEDEEAYDQLMNLLRDLDADEEVEEVYHNFAVAAE